MTRVARKYTYKVHGISFILEPKQGGTYWGFSRKEITKMDLRLADVWASIFMVKRLTVMLSLSFFLKTTNYCLECKVYEDNRVRFSAYSEPWLKWAKDSTRKEQIVVKMFKERSCMRRIVRMWPVGGNYLVCQTQAKRGYHLNCVSICFQAKVEQKFSGRELQALYFSCVEVKQS